MLLLLPPSEGKAAPPRRGRPLDLAALSFPELTATRARVLDALVELCADRERAHAVLGLTSGLADAVDLDLAVRRTPVRPASDLYTGVLFGALGLATLDPAARRRAARSVVVLSALWGAVRPGDRLPAYRLPIGVALPGLGPLAGAWRDPLAAVLPAAVGRGAVVDLRSAAYAAAWRPTGALAERTVGVRVLREEEGVRTVVSHLAKHTRGEVARHLLGSGADPRAPAQVAALLNDRWHVELTDGAPARLDVVLAPSP